MTLKRVALAVAFAVALASMGCSSSNTSGTSGSSGTSGGNGEPQPPPSITITAASKSEIDLSWTPSPSSNVTYTLARAAAGTTTFAPVSALQAGLTFNDTTVDAFTDYTYQVQAVSPDGGSPFTATTHPAGPPPAGFALAAPLPSGASSSAYGTDVSQAADKNGDMALAFLWRDPNGDSVDDDNAAYFVSWNRKDFVWNAAVQVATVGASTNTVRQLSLAHDDASDTFALAATTTAQGAANTTITVYTSSAGGAWSPTGSLTVSGSDVDQPSLAIHAGTAHLAYYLGDAAGSGVHYATGAVTSAPYGWTSSAMPLLANANSGNEEPLTLALDSAGTPAVAMFQDVNSNQGTAIAYWRPGQSSAVQLTGSEVDTSSELDLSLAFDGTKPRVAFITQNDPSGQNLQAWVSASTDGLTWGQPAALPNDHSATLDPQIGIAVGSAGQVAVVSESNASTGDEQYGNPKLSTSSSTAGFSTSSPDANKSQAISGGVDGYDVVRFAGNSKLNIAGHNHAGNTSSGLADGVFYWAQP